MGTPEFAAIILDRLIEMKEIEIVAVVTAPDKPAGRGRAIRTSEVKSTALSNDLKILQPSNLKDPAFIEQLETLNADLFVVIAFRMLPEIVWAMPKEGTINLHASLLPNYRGAAPINWAVINGEVETGVTTFFIEKEIDTGAIIEQKRILIGPDETVGELYKRLITLGGEAMISTILKISSQKVISIPQAEMTHSKAFSPAPKIFKEDGKISFKHAVSSVHNFCRGLDPYPGAWCTLSNADNVSKTFKLFSTQKTSLPSDPDQMLTSNKEGILIACEDYYLLVREIQPEGKRRMTSLEFIAGHQIETFTIIQS
ncbi:MAG: methionyl-tRNA formyltransferase [Flavobacteriaceae bacterium]|jgi:methionyl-tRNA formyltransferase